MDMITAQTEIDNLIEKTETAKKKIGIILADFALTRAKTNKYQHIENEIDTLTKNLSSEEKADVLSYAIVAIIKNTASTSSRQDDNRHKQQKKRDIFTNREL